jgi:vacuolar-type H+-ATPase subunit B/Vma2
VSGFDPTAPVTFTMRHILSAVWFIIASAMAVIGAGALIVWAVVSFTIGGIRDDVKSTRETVQTLQTTDKTSAINLRETENRFADRIAKLDSSFIALSGRLDVIGAKIDAINESIDGLSKRLDAVAQTRPDDDRRRRRR